MVDIARQRSMRVHVGPIVSSDVFYDPDSDRIGDGPTAGTWASRWRRRSCSRSPPLRKVSTGCLLTVSDTLYTEEIVRISDEDLKRGVDDMMALAARVATSDLDGPDASTAHRTGPNPRWASSPR